ncbi:hypothetical protein SAMN05661091_2728 [Paenibacillus uliginis N3/975]|uniref:Uncharacterized protein n=1 Tax=Paenibacillus uliginis N3/975 TaxID=1313296 RepID=A0A1X7HE96_9BACL|nr:hypothetical protein [Paenibacillus uliginis]SMF84880.1 hypothetical protein SAMN05661091_2728 [Paenibacillus uliginis N3/975]
MREYSSLLEQLEAWTSELLLRGVAQIGLKDVERLQELLAGAKRWDMAFLQELMEPLIDNGRKMALGEGDETLLLFQYCRLAQYVQAGLQERV